MSSGIDISSLTGTIGGAIISTAVSITSFWFIIAKVIHSSFIKPQIEALKAENERQAARITQLETILLMHGPQELRRAMQTTLSEVREREGS